LTCCSQFGKLGFTSRAIILAFETSSESSSSRFGNSSSAMALMPVTLPPGLAQLAMRPKPTGSPTLVKTIGIVGEARFAATAEAGAAAGY
jgi:hypothetical protein